MREFGFMGTFFSFSKSRLDNVIDCSQASTVKTHLVFLVEDFY